ncbi:MAG: AraC family transcriptional regulator [Clostridia bacterium]|nr:AraC family transcriptional regulator [Clostridia bacterium]
MSNNNLPFSLEIPTQYGFVKIIFFVTEKLHIQTDAASSIMHCHNDYELRYVASGTGKQTIVESDYISSAGDVILFHPNEYHNQIQESSSHDFSQYSIRFAIKHQSNHPTEEQIRGYNKLVQIFDSIHIIKDSSFSLIEDFRQLNDEIINKRCGYFHTVQAYCTLIITKLLRLCEVKAKGLFPPNELRYNAHTRVQIDMFFNFRYMDNIKLCDLASCMNVSERHSSRYIKELFGKSFSEKLLEVRIEQAKLQLMKSDKDLNQIAASCGFQSSTYFSYAFRKALGITPSQFRTQFSAENEKNEEQ